MQTAQRNMVSHDLGWEVHAQGPARPQESACLNHSTVVVCFFLFLYVAAVLSVYMALL